MMAVLDKAEQISAQSVQIMILGFGVSTIVGRLRLLWVGGSLAILRGFRRGFLGQGPKLESRFEPLGRQPGACLHLHPYPFSNAGQ